jgi:hypothetical protein
MLFKDTVDYDLLLQYVYPENEDLIALKAIAFGLYFTYYRTRQLILVSLDQFDYLLKLAKMLREHGLEDASSALGQLMLDEAFGLVPQPLHDRSVSYPRVPFTIETCDIDLDALFAKLNEFDSIQF